MYLSELYWLIEVINGPKNEPKAIFINAEVGITKLCPVIFKISSENKSK